jgi:hypothetical protein
MYQPRAFPVLDPETDEWFLRLMTHDDDACGTLFDRAETPREAQERRYQARQARDVVIMRQRGQEARDNLIAKRKRGILSSEATRLAKEEHAIKKRAHVERVYDLISHRTIDMHGAIELLARHGFTKNDAISELQYLNRHRRLT